MARSDIHIYKLTKLGKKNGIHTLSANGETVKVQKDGETFRVPDPGIQHPDAHCLVYIGVEGSADVKDALAAAVKDAEEKLKDAIEAAKTDTDKDGAKAKVKAAEEVLSDAKKLQSK